MLKATFPVSESHASFLSQHRIQSQYFARNIRLQFYKLEDMRSHDVAEYSFVLPVIAIILIYCYLFPYMSVAKDLVQHLA